MSGGNAPLSRRGVVRRLAPAEGVATNGPARVVFTAIGCAGCGWGGGAIKELPVRTDLPEGTVVDVHIPTRRLLGQAAIVFAPPLAAALCAVAAFGEALAGWSAVLGLLVGTLAAVAARLVLRGRVTVATPAAATGNLTLRPVGEPAAN